MITAALKLELHNLLRSPLRLTALALVLAAGCFVIQRGQDEVARWESAIETGRQAEAKTLGEARSYLAAGELGPADRPWVRLTEPRWQDFYAATRLARTPAPLAGIAYASPEAGAVTMKVDRRTDPTLENGSKLENPALAVVGGLDLVTVLALLLPLLIIALGLDIGGYERANGLMPMIRVQSGRDGAWIGARCLAVAAIAAAAGLLLTLISSLATDASLADALPLGLLVLAYVALWSALLGVVGMIARHPAHGAVTLGGAWIVLCVLIPAIAVGRSASIAAEDFAVDLTVEARDAGSALAQLGNEELYARLFARFPALREAAPEVLDSGRRYALQGLSIVALEERIAQREARGTQYADLVSTASWASPAVALTHALEGLAGRGPTAANAYLRAVAAAAADRMEAYVAASWSDEPLGDAEFEALVAGTPRVSAPPAAAWWQQGIILLTWILGLLGLSRLLALRMR